MTQFGAGWGRAGRNVTRGVGDPAPAETLQIVPGTSNITANVSTAKPADELGALVDAMSRFVRQGASLAGKLIKEAGADDAGQEAAERGAAEVSGATHGDVVGELYKIDDIEQYDDEGNVTSNNTDELIGGLNDAKLENGEKGLSKAITGHATFLATDSLPDDYPVELRPYYISEMVKKVTPQITAWYGRRTKERREINNSMIANHLATGSLADLREAGIRSGRDSRAWMKSQRKNPNNHGLTDDDIVSTQMAGASIALSNGDFDRTHLLLNAIPDGVASRDQAKMRAELIKAERTHVLTSAQDSMAGITSSGLAAATRDVQQGDNQGWLGTFLGQANAMNMRRLIDLSNNDETTRLRFIESVKSWNAEESRTGGLGPGERSKVLTELYESRTVDKDGNSVRVIDPNSSVGAAVSQLIVELPDHETVAHARMKRDREAALYDAENQAFEIVNNGTVTIGGEDYTSIPDLEVLYGKLYPGISGHFVETIRKARDNDNFAEDEHSKSGARTTREMIVNFGDQIRFGTPDPDTGVLEQSGDQRIRVGRKVNKAFIEGLITQADRDNMLSLIKTTGEIEPNLRGRDFHEAMENVMTAFWNSAGAKLVVRGDVLTASNWALPKEGWNEAHVHAPMISRGMKLSYESWLKENLGLKSSDVVAYNRNRTHFLSNLSSAYAEIANREGYQYSPQAESTFKQWYGNIRLKNSKLPNSPAGRQDYDFRALYKSGETLEVDDNGLYVLPPRHQIESSNEHPVIDGIDIITGTPTSKEDTNQ
jgi:hypothetical protein